jgi:LysR family transcriptional regulator, low CO2-responsive transcriptional regulator
MSRPLKNATLRQLATFHTLARLGSVSRTAEEMHLTQPAVSLQLGILEESAGTPLLARGVRGVRLTEAGELLATYSERMLALWREAGEAMAAQRGQVAGTLRVGAVTTAEYLLPQLLLAFVREHPQVKVKLQVGNRGEIVGKLAAQDIDLAIMGRAPPELKVVAAPFARHPMAFVTAPTHPLMSLAAPSLQDINDANLLVRERGSGTRTAVEQLHKAGGVEMRVGAEMSSNEAIKQMCAAGFGVAFISLHACVLELKSGLLAQVPMANHPIMRDWYVICLDGRPVPAAAAAFSAYLQEHGQARVNDHLAMHRPPAAPAETAVPTARRAKSKPRSVSSDVADASATSTD